MTGSSPAGTSTPVLSNVAYLPFGPYTALTNGNGVAEWRGFDQDYRLTVTFTKIRPIWNKIWRFGSQAAASRKVLKSFSRADHS
jgi:hypothetical protein